jgi:hypothetical protein
MNRVANGVKGDAFIRDDEAKLRSCSSVTMPFAFTYGWPPYNEARCSLPSPPRRQDEATRGSEASSRTRRG